MPGGSFNLWDTLTMSEGELCPRCPHPFDPHRLCGNFKAPDLVDDIPVAGWMDCPEPGCDCWSTWSFSHPDMSTEPPTSTSYDEGTRLARAPTTADIAHGHNQGQGRLVVAHRISQRATEIQNPKHHGQCTNWPQNVDCDGNRRKNRRRSWWVMSSSWMNTVNR